MIICRIVMFSRENPIYGRKVFFLNPTLAINKFIVEKLRDLEYESYCIDDYRDAKPILRKSEDAICFINIDDQLSIREWFNFIKSFETDPTLQSIFIGVLSTRARKSDKETFIMNTKLPGGFVVLNGHLEDTLKNLIGILNINGAKGKRKFIRLDCPDRTDINGYVASGSKLYSFRLISISSQGFICVAPLDMAFLFKPKTLLKNVSLTVERINVIFSTVVVNVQLNANACIVIMLMTKGTSAEVKSIIKKYIFKVLDSQYKAFYTSSMKDMEDYSRLKTSEVFDFDTESKEGDKKAKENGDVSAEDSKNIKKDDSGVETIEEEKQPSVVEKVDEEKKDQVEGSEIKETETDKDSDDKQRSSENNDASTEKNKKNEKVAENSSSNDNEKIPENDKKSS